MASTTATLSERREAKALKRMQRREQKYLRKEALEMERMKEILEADSNMLSGGVKKKRRDKKKAAVSGLGL